MISLTYLSATLQWMGSLCIFLLCVYRWKSLGKNLKAVGVYGGLSFFFQLLQVVSLLYFKSRFNNLVANVYAPIELLSLLVIYYYTAQMVKYGNALAVLSVMLCIVLSGIGLSSPNTLNGISETMRDITMIACAFVYFLMIMKDTQEEDLTETPMFWINSSILFFFSCTFILSISLEYIQEVLREGFAIFWISRNFLRTGFCVVICIGIWKAVKMPVENLAKSKVP